MKKTLTLFFSCILLLSVFMIFSPIKNCRAAETLHVGSGQTYTSIQDAIDAANASGGDTIYVHSGSYSEKITIDKTLTLTGENKGTTTITGSGGHTVTVTASNVVISGFTIQNTFGSSYAGVFLNSVSNCDIYSCSIKNCGNGIYLVSSDDNKVRNNDPIRDNNVGVYLSSSDNNEVYSNNINNNIVYGVDIRTGSTSNYIYQNTFSNNAVKNARDQETNSWDKNSLGNSWSDYTGVDDNGDNIGDTPYTIYGTGNSQDNYPLGVFQTSNNKPLATILSPSSSPISSYFGESIYFNGRGDDTDGDTLSYLWTSSRDGQLSTSKSFSESSLSMGTHTITFKVYDGQEWSEEKTININIIEPPTQNTAPTCQIALPNQASYTFGEVVPFQSSDYDAEDGTASSWTWWSEPEGISSGQRYFTKSDIPIGEYTVFLKVCDTDGACSATVSKNIKIEADPTVENNNPTADAGGPYFGYNNVNIEFDGSASSDPDTGDTLTYMWNFGDGTTGQGVNAKHNYTFPGNYTVLLTVGDSYGSQSISTTYANITIKPDEPNQPSKPKEENKGIPGFEITILLTAIALLIYLKKR